MPEAEMGKTPECKTADRDESEAKFQSYINHSPCGVFVADENGRYVEVNPAATRLTGYSEAELLQMSTPDLLTADSSGPGLDRCQFLKEKGVFSGESQFLHKDGTTRWWSVEAVKLSDNRYLSFVKDITGRKLAEAELRATNRKFESLIKASPIGIATLKTGGTVSLWNPALERMFGWTAKEVLGRPLPFIPPEKREEYEGIISRIMSGEQITGVELLRTRKDGSPVDISLSTALYFDDDGNIAGVIGLIQDITERKRAEAALHESEERYRSLFDNMLDGLAYCRMEYEAGQPTDFVYLAVNKAYETLTGLKEVVGKRFTQVIPGARSSDKGLLEICDRVVRTGVPEKFEMYVHSLGIWFWTGVYRLAKEHFVVVFDVITERKQAEAVISETAKRLELATASGRLGVWDWDIKNNRMQWNDRMFELYGVAKDAFPASIDAWLNGLHPEDRKTAVAENQAAIAGVKEYDTSFRVLHPDGTVRFIKADGLVIRDRDGAALRMLGLNKDITESKLADEEKAKLQEQLLHAQKLESVGRLAGGVAHDFNNMLGVILGHVDIALARLESAQPIAANLEEIRKAAERSTNLTRQLLAFARKQMVVPKVLDLNDAVEEALKMLRRLIGEDIDLAWLRGAGVMPVHVDPSQIDQILANLCVNARDAIAGVGKITIETGNAVFDEASCAVNPGFVPGAYVLFCVSDDGSGMDKETLAHIFDPFFTTKELGTGTGLGLAMVYGAVKQNNGFINAQSELGKGSTFRIYLPRHVGNIEPTVIQGPEKAALQGRETILLVEDEPALVAVATEMLTSLGYTVLSGHTPDEAIRLAGENPGKIQLLMTDVVMPEMNGRDLAQKLQSLSPSLKCLFMSGYTADIITHHGVLEEGVNFIQKPFSMIDLAAKVRAVLREGGSFREGQARNP